MLFQPLQSVGLSYYFALQECLHDLAKSWRNEALGVGCAESVQWCVALGQGWLGRLPLMV
jgi:hypothetical protein